MKKLFYRLKHTALYSYYGWKMVVQQRSLRIVLPGFRFFSQWLRDYESGFTTVGRRMPWINYEAQIYLNALVKPGMKVFEWGSGGSTLFWADHCEQVISVEHDRQWYKILSEILASEGEKNVVYRNVLPEETEESLNYRIHIDFASGSINGYQWVNYVRQIAEFPDEYFDIILVDGRARNACIFNALPKLKKNGFLIVDNSERKYYTKEFKAIFDGRNWESKVFVAPAPFQHAFTQTTFYRKLQ